MPFYIDTRFEGSFPSPSYFPGQSIIHLIVTWKVSRHVYLRTSSAILPPPEDEHLRPSASASASGSTSFYCFLGSGSNLHRQIRDSLASLNFTRSVTNFLWPKITTFALGLAADRSGPPYPSIIVSAHLNFVENPSFYSIHRTLAISGWVDDIFAAGTSTEDSDGSDDEEGEEDNSEGASDSVIERLRRRKLDKRGGEVESCSVCLETFSDGEEVIQLRCEHIYHESCIVIWLKKSQSCPLCRRRKI